VLLSHDLLGIEDRLIPRFVKRYANVGDIAREALETFASEVRSGAFPDAAHSYSMSDDVITALRKEQQGG
jgi:3-methyl-2-oxobutanoate hydroxymethyltransferase